VPLYAFDCAGCGPFELVRPMADAGAPGTCPACGARARRVFTAPGLPRLARPVFRGLELEEKSAHEPGVVATKRGRAIPHRHPPAPPWVLSH
jgi:putative FmdB family regulatory protein